MTQHVRCWSRVGELVSIFLSIYVSMLVCQCLSVELSYGYGGKLYLLYLLPEKCGHMYLANCVQTFSRAKRWQSGFGWLGRSGEGVNPISHGFFFKRQGDSSNNHSSGEAASGDA